MPTVRDSRRLRRFAQGAAVGVIVGAGFGGTVVSLARRATMRDPLGPVARVLSVDRSRERITLLRTRDSEVEGRYSVYTPDNECFAYVGEVVDQTPHTVVRHLIAERRGQLHHGDDVRFSGAYFEHPGDRRLSYENVIVETPVGPAPAWFVPGRSTKRWVIHVHGRGAARSECVRGLTVCKRAGLTSLVISYRNDPEAPASGDGRYNLGASEWADVDAALRYARAHGAEEVILWGWSMGGAIVLETLTASSRAADFVTGVILESAVVDWRTTLRFQAELRRMPRIVTDTALAVINSPWASRLVGQQHPIPLDELDFVRRASEITVPVLALYSANDGVVPVMPVRRFARALPDLVTLVRHPTAMHTRLWNADSSWWEGCISDWLDRYGYAAT